MCVWPLLTQHMHARACQSRYPQNVHATPQTRHTNDQARAGGPNETTARRQARDVSHKDHKCNVRVCS